MFRMFHNARDNALSSQLSALGRSSSAITLLSLKPVQALTEEELKVLLQHYQAELLPPPVSTDGTTQVVQYAFHLGLMLTYGYNGSKIALEEGEYFMRLAAKIESQYNLF